MGTILYPTAKRAITPKSTSQVYSGAIGLGVCAVQKVKNARMDTNLKKRRAEYEV